MPDIVYLRDVQPRSGFFKAWERQRHGPIHWFVECFAEFLGVFFYVYAGAGATVPFVIGPLIDQPGLGSLLQIGFGYAAGIILAVSICAPTSGGHINPCISIANVILRGFPPLKALRYIIAQILGGYVACLLVYAQYHDLFKIAEHTIATDTTGKLSHLMFTPNGPAGVLAFYAQPGLNLGRIFLNEFVVDTFLAITIWGCLDPTNVFVPPPAAPFIIALAYAAAIWGYAVEGIAANSARDIGGRLAAMTIWGREAAGTPGYAAIAALTNIPATLFGFMLYEFFLMDSDRVMPGAQREFLNLHKYHGRSPHAVQTHEAEGSVSSEKGNTTHV